MYGELVEHIVKSLVDYPEAVSVREVQDDRTTVIELLVAESDTGRVIGKSGRVINAIRAVVQVPAARNGDRVNVEVM